MSVDKEQMRKKIMTAALLVFSRYGYKKTNISDISESAGMAKTSLYYYFKNKEEILLSTAEWKIEEYLEKAEALLSTDESVEELFTKYIHFHFDYINEYYQRYHTHIDEFFQLIPVLESRMRLFVEKLHKIIAKFMTRFNETSAYSPQEIDEIAYLLIFTVKGIEIGMHYKPEAYSKMLDSFIEFALRGMRNQ